MDGARSKGLVGFVWRHSRREQCGLLFLTVISFPLVYASLEIPKIIVNDAISGGPFPKVVAGVELGQVSYLLALSAAFLALVIAHNGLKWVINVGLGMSGERLLRRLRLELTERVSRLPMGRLRSTRPGETIQSIMAEIEPLGGFFGEVIVTPVFQGGLLAVYVGFIFAQDPWLGLASIAFYPVQTVLVPMLQRRIIRLNRKRANNARAVADRIGETIELAPDIRTHGTARWHLARVARLLETNTRIRQDIFRRKYTIKFLNNFLAQLTPFLFYAIGGYLVIQGSLDLGALVAVLAAYKDLAGPWKALLAYAQRLSDFSSRFRFVQEGFEDTAPAGAPEEAGAPLEGALVVETVPPDPALDRPGIHRITLHPGETLVVSGGSPANRTALLRLAAGVDPAEAGTVAVGGQALAGASPGAIGATLGLVPEAPGLVRGTLRENLIYGLLRRPPGPDSADEQPWIDWEAAGLDGPTALDQRVIALAERFGLAGFLQTVALDRTLSAEESGRWSTTLMALREELAADPARLADLVEPWQAEAYNTNGSLLANLLFALPVAPVSRPSQRLASPDLRKILKKTGGDRLLLTIGVRIAEALAEIARATDPCSGLLDRVSGFSRQDILDAAAIRERAGNTEPARLPREARARLTSLAANFVETRDQLDVIEPATRARVLEIRKAVAPLLRVRSDVVPLDTDRYHPARTVADNILHGQRRHDRRSRWPLIDERIEGAIAARAMTHDLLRIALDAELGAAPVPVIVQRRIGLIRALAKRPRLLLVASAPDLFPGGEAALVAAIRADQPGIGILLATETADPAIPKLDGEAVIGTDGPVVAHRSGGRTERGDDGD